MTNSILTCWNTPRILRLVLGAIIIIQGVHTTAWLPIVAGTLFSLTALFNVGCCAGSACSVPVAKKSSKTDYIEYEEVKKK